MGLMTSQNPSLAAFTCSMHVYAGGLSMPWSETLRQTPQNSQQRLALPCKRTQYSSFLAPHKLKPCAREQTQHTRYRRRRLGIQSQVRLCLSPVCPYTERCVPGTWTLQCWSLSNLKHSACGIQPEVTKSN